MSDNRSIITVTRPYLPNIDKYKQKLEEIWNNNWLTNQGPMHQQFEQRLAQMFDQHQITLTVNGHMALDIMLKGLGITGEVITTPFTFASTTHAITMNGLEPVFCDIQPDDYCLDADKLESLITEKTSAIMPVHVYGVPCNVEKIDAIAKKYNLKVLYDAAHAFGSKLNGIPVPEFGDVSMLSFHATKLFHSIEGGALIYSDKSLKRMFDTYKNFGIEGEEQIDFVGLNAKMNEFQAAMGLCLLDEVPALIQERKLITERYHARLDSIPGLRLFDPHSRQGLEYNYAYLPMAVDPLKYGLSRDDLYNLLKANNILARKYFYPLVSDYGCYSSRFDSNKTPVAQKAAKEMLCLPIYNGLSLEDVDRICSLIRNK